MSTFIACIEQPQRMAFEIKWDGPSVPHFIKFPDGSVISLVGKYASAGERFCYRRVDPFEINHAEFQIVPFNKMAGVS